jgi:hypothetical protein
VFLGVAGVAGVEVVAEIETSVPGKPKIHILYIDTLIDT